MKELLPVILLFLSSICCAEDWVYTGSSTEFIPVSRQLGEDWSRGLTSTSNEQNELKRFFQSAHPVDSGITTNYEIFRRKNRIRELSDVEFYFEDEALGKQTYRLVILLFPDKQKLETYWKASHPENIDSPVFTTVIEESHCCIFRLQNIYVKVSSKALSTECERIAGMVFNMIQLKQKGSNQSQ
jgi:hypothetical protein